MHSPSSIPSSHWIWGVILTVASVTVTPGQQRAATAEAFQEGGCCPHQHISQGLGEDSPLDQEFPQNFSVNGQKVNILDFAGHMAKSRI